MHREVSLPPISDAGYNNLAKNYVGYYLEREGARFCFMELDHHRIESISELIGALKLTPRQIQEVFRTLGHLFETSEGNRGKLLWCLGIGSVAMAVFKIGAPNIFRALGNQALDPVDAMIFIKQTIDPSYPDWLFTLFYTGGGLKVGEDESLEVVMKRVGLIDDADNHDVRRDLSQWRSGWGHYSSNRFKQIYEKILQISQWD